MTDKIKNLLLRTASGAVLIVVVFGAVLWSSWSLGALLALLTVGGLTEFYALARKCGAEPQMVIGTAAGLGVLAIACCSEACGGGGYGLLLLLPLAFICELWRKSEHPLANIAATLMGVLYVAVPFALLYRFVYSGGHDLLDFTTHKLLLLGFIVTIWANDVCAYLIGWAVGRHPLFPRLSPKKSWEGFVGGLFGAVGFGLLIAWFLGHSYGFWAGLALVAAVTGVAGDLVESMFKRAAGVKDSGRLIPGHGGVLDRFDALLLATPFVYAYLCCFL